MVESLSHLAIPPGETIKEMLADRGMSQKEFAIRMGLSEKHVSKLINGEVQLTMEVSSRLETVLGAPARFWNNLEAIYREELLKANAENEVAADADMAKLMPYNEMSERGWVPKTGRTAERVLNLRKFFEVVDLSLLENEMVTRAVGQKLVKEQKSSLAFVAWAQEVKREARALNTQRIDVKKLSSAAKNIRKLTTLKTQKAESAVRETLAGSGVALITLPALKDLKERSAAIYDGNRVAVGLTVDNKEEIAYWYSLCYEIARLIRMHGNKETTVTEDSILDYSYDLLIPAADFEEFKTEGDYSENSIIRFAKELEISPKIVEGRLQKERLTEYGGKLKQ